MSAPVLETPRLRIPRIGLGTWTLRGAEAQQAVEGAIGLGYRHIDTAAMYGNEDAVGACIAASGVRRSEIFLTTKVWWTDLAPDALRASAETELARAARFHRARPDRIVGPRVLPHERIREVIRVDGIGVSSPLLQAHSGLYSSSVRTAESPALGLPVTEAAPAPFPLPT